MGKFRNSKIVAWLALCVVVTVICVTFSLREQWWSFIDIFFAFMMVFSHLLALYLGKMSKSAAGKLDRLSLIFGIMTILAIIGEYIAWQTLY